MDAPSYKRKVIDVPITHDLEIRASLVVCRGVVEAFQVALMHVEGQQRQWLVRDETHGGAPHRHFRRADDGPGRHRPLPGWPTRYSDIVDRAMADLATNARSYLARYLAWKR